MNIDELCHTHHSKRKTVTVVQTRPPNFGDVAQVISARFRRVVTISSPRLHSSQAFPVVIGGFATHWLVNLHVDPKTRGVYLLRVWVHLRAIRASCVMLVRMS